MKKDELQFTISRYDHFYDSINNKGQFFLALCTFLIGSIGVGFFSIKDLSAISFNLAIVTIFLFAASILTIYFVLKALIPFWGTSEKKSIVSLISFEAVRKLKKETFVSKVQHCNETEYEADLARQAHELATGLSRKFHRLKWAGWLLLFQFILIIPFTYLIYQHLKK